MLESELAERLKKIERDNRRLKAFGLVTLILAVALGGISYAVQPVSENITAHGFEVVDSSGKRRIVMRVLPSGEPGIWLSDAQGNTRVEIGPLPWGQPGIWLTDAQGKSRVEIGAVPWGEPSISLSDAQGKSRVDIITSEPRGPSIRLIDRQGFSMELGGTGNLGPSGLATEETSAASIVMFGNDKQQRVIWRAP